MASPVRTPPRTLDINPFKEAQAAADPKYAAANNARKAGIAALNLNAMKARAAERGAAAALALAAKTPQGRLVQTAATFAKASKNAPLLGSTGGRRQTRRQSQRQSQRQQRQQRQSQRQNRQQRQQRQSQRQRQQQRQQQRQNQ